MQKKKKKIKMSAAVMISAPVICCPGPIGWENSGNINFLVCKAHCCVQKYKLPSNFLPWIPVPAGVRH